MLRIHFTVADATKVRVVVLGPLAELQLSFKLGRRSTSVASEPFMAGCRVGVLSRTRPGC